MSFTYGADGSLIKNKPSRSGDLAFEQFDVNKQIESFASLSNEIGFHKEQFQDMNNRQNQQIDKFQNYLNKYSSHLQNQELVYNNTLNTHAEKFSNFIRNQENMCGSKLNHQNLLLSQQRDVLKKQQGTIEYFNVLNEAQNNSNLQIAETYKNLTESYPEHFTME